MTVSKGLIRPKSVVGGQRIAQRARTKKHKDRPQIGRGNYVKAPLLRDKATKPRWMANAVVNNPGNALAVSGVGAGSTALLSQRDRVKKADDRKKEAVAGGLVGAGGGHLARVGAGYGAKATAERQFKPMTNRGNYGPYKEGPHKATLNRYKRTVHGDVREKARQFDANFPKGIPSYRARKVLTALDKKPAVAGAVAGGAALGAGLAAHRRKVSKARKDHTASGSAIAGASAVTAGVGAAAGGAPGVKADIRPMLHPEPGIRGRAKKAKAVRGGVLGFRHNAHAGGIYGFKQKATEEAWSGPPKTSHDAFFRGRNAGKIGPEETILRHLKGGKRAAGAALVGGAATTAYGVHRARVKKDRRGTQAYSGTLAGVGATGLGVSGGVHHLLRHQERKWAGAARHNLQEAGAKVPSIAGRSDSDIRRDPKLLKGVPKHVAEQAGHLRGAAAQHAHFAHVYGDTAKTVGRLRGPSAIVAGVGAGGLLAARKKKVSKNLSAFGVEHG